MYEREKKESNRRKIFINEKVWLMGLVTSINIMVGYFTASISKLLT